MRGVFAPGAGRPVPRRDEVGGKARALFDLAWVGGPRGFDVPAFVALAPEAFDGEALADGAWEALLEELAAQGVRGGRVAVRSSALEEDGAVRSYAGLFETVLGVPLEDAAVMRDALARVRRSAGSAHARAYGARAGEADEARMGVVVQAMVEPEASGVAFSCDPVTGDTSVAVVSAVYGLGEGLVSGRLDADTARVRGDREPVEWTLAHKIEAVRSSPEGGTRVEPLDPALADHPAIDDGEARLIASRAQLLAVLRLAPQDVEWAIVGPERRLVVLQTRPVTAAGASGERLLWDNSNIVESYGGVTTALTFTFARAAYEVVYRQFCEVMGVPRAVIEANRAVFANMLGLVRGRVYYNLRNWYRMLALLPGFAWNRGFMEQMMGVRESLGESFERPGAGDRLRDFARLVSMIVRMITSERGLDAAVPRFLARVERELAPLTAREPIVASAGEGVALYRALERELLANWRTPIVNDFFAMIFFGTLTKLTAKWLPDEPPTLVNDLLCGEGGIVSTEPARRLMELARRVDASPAVARRFDETSDEEALWRALAADDGGTGVFAELDRYRRDFGDRCMEELKLETITLGERPAVLLKTVRAYRASGRTDAAAAAEREKAIRGRAEERVAARLGVVRRATYRFVLGRARRRVRDRENLRFARTRVFGAVRRIFLVLGADLARRGVLDAPRDVFDLTREEIFTHYEDGAAADLRALARERRARFERWAREPAPPDRFETVGAPDAWFEGPASDAAGVPPRHAPADDANELRGTGCCPGVVRAPVRIVTDPRDVTDLKGRILVAERTDPGWTLLFPVASGLLVERGSLLSHSAIVAREIGLPCVVGVRGLLATLEDGEEVEMDGTSGVIRRTGSRA